MNIKKHMNDQLISQIQEAQKLADLMKPQLEAQKLAELMKPHLEAQKLADLMKPQLEAQKLADLMKPQMGEYYRLQESISAISGLKFAAFAEYKNLIAAMQPTWPEVGSRVGELYGTSARLIAALQIEKFEGIRNTFQGTFARQLEEFRKAMTPQYQFRQIAHDLLNQQTEFLKLQKAVISAHSLNENWGAHSEVQNYLRSISAVELGSAMKELRGEPGGTSEQVSVLDTLLVWLSDDVSPFLKKLAVYIILYVLMPYAISIVANLHTPYYEDWYKRFRGDDKRIEARKIKSEAAQKFPSLVLREYRLVTTKSLNLRLNPKGKSPSLAILQFGMTVRFIKKEGDWSYVAFVGQENEEEIFGWVFSRYIRPLVAPSRLSRIDEILQKEVGKRLATLDEAKPIKLDDL